MTNTVAILMLALAVALPARSTISARETKTGVAQSAAYRVDPARSRATIHVGKAGAFGFIAGHTHEVSGPIQSGTVDADFDAPTQSRIRLVIAAAELKVSAEGEPEGDPPKVQQTMESEQVLDVRRYPTIMYESTGVTLKNRRANAMELSITGQLAIRGVTRPVTAPVRVELVENGLSASGRFEIKQTTFGIKPVSVGGVVSVKDALEIDFSIVATKPDAR